jgi:hypothetical protein
MFKIKYTLNSVCLLIFKIFNRSNLNKVIFIFIFGLISRAIINNVYNDALSDYVYQISATSYLLFSSDLYKFTDFNKFIFSFKMEDFKLSSLRRVLKSLFNSRNKMTLEEVNEPSRFTSNTKFKISTISEMKPSKNPNVRPYTHNPSSTNSQSVSLPEPSDTM